MFKLIAISPDDGWAFVERNRRIVLVRPPYRSGNLANASVQVVEKAIYAYGFRSADQHFADWGSLIEFLRTPLTQAPALISQREAFKELLSDAPPRILSSHLDRVEDELVPSRQWATAVSVLGLMLETEAMRTNPQLHVRATNLLAKCSSLMLNRVNGRERVATLLSSMFPRAAQQFPTMGNFAQDVAQYHQTIRVGG